MKKVGLLDHRVCSRCKEDKTAEHFQLIKSKGILCSICKKCINKRNYTLRADRMKVDPEFMEHRRRIDKKSREKHFSIPGNREKKREQSRKYGLTHKASEAEIESRKRRYYRIKSDPMIYSDVKRTANERAKVRRKSDPQYRISCYLRNYLNAQIKKRDTWKKGRIKEGVGCSMAELVAHIEKQFEPGMTWDNWGNKVGCWSIDHRWPMSRWNMKSAAHQLMCNHFTNLRPMWHIENIKKQNKIAA